MGNLQRYLAHLSEVAPFTWPSRGAFRCLYGPARMPPVLPRSSADMDVQRTLRELTLADVRNITGWVAPPNPSRPAYGDAPASAPHP